MIPMLVWHETGSFYISPTRDWELYRAIPFNAGVASVWSVRLRRVFTVLLTALLQCGHPTRRERQTIFRPSDHPGARRPHRVARFGH